MIKINNIIDFCNENNLSFEYKHQCFNNNEVIFKLHNTNGEKVFKFMELIKTLIDLDNCRIEINNKKNQTFIILPC